MGAEIVVPVLRYREDVIEVAFVEDDQTVQNLVLNRLYYALNMCPQVGGTRGHLRDRHSRLAEDLIEGGRVFHVVVAEEIAGWREALVA